MSDHNTNHNKQEYMADKKAGKGKKSGWIAVGAVAALAAGAVWCRAKRNAALRKKRAAEAETDGAKPSGEAGEGIDTTETEDGDGTQEEENDADGEVAPAQGEEKRV